jgi:hypothetical protein
LSAPPVRIESKAWTDSRYGALAMRLGLQNPRFALILVAGVWRWQTEHYSDEEPTYIVHRAVVEGELLSLEGPEALVAANLAEFQADGRLRIKGGRDDEGNSRIDWLWRSRQQRRAAGRSRAQGPREGGRFAQGSATAPPAIDQRDASGPPPTPVPDHRAASDPPATDQRRTSSPDSGLRTLDPDVSLSAGARDGGDPDPAPLSSGTIPGIPPVATTPPPARGRDLFASLAEELHDRHAAEARKLKSAIKGCENVSVGGGPLMGEERSAVIAVVSRGAAEAADAGVDVREHVMARMDHLLVVRAAAARRDRHLRWWTTGRFWRWSGIEIDLGQTVEQVRAIEKPREGARFAAERGPVAVPAAPSVADTQRQLEEQRAAAARAAAEREEVAAELERAKAAMGVGVVNDLAKKLGGGRR